MTSKRLLELIDACQPESNDLDEAELRELATELSQNPQLQDIVDQSRALDLAIRARFQDVTPPAGLVERLVDAVENQSDHAQHDDGVSESSERSVELPRRESKTSRRRWIGAVTTLAIIAAVVMFLSKPSSDKWLENEATVAAQVDQWNEQVNIAEWNSADKKPLKKFPTWGRIPLGRDVRWSWIEVDRIVCYDLPITGGAARLFVMKPSSAVNLPTTPPAGYPSGAGWHVGTWQANGRVYFLAVQAGRNSKRLYSQLVRIPTA